MRTRSVFTASRAAVAQGSGNTSCPSMTHTFSHPAASASWAISMYRGCGMSCIRNRSHLTMPLHVAWCGHVENRRLMRGSLELLAHYSREAKHLWQGKPGLRPLSRRHSIECPRREGVKPVATSIRSSLTSWTTIVPIVATVVLLLAWGRGLPILGVVVVTALLGGVVLAAVHHAEVVAHRVGEPYGSLVLGVAVTVIEVALIVTLMIAGGGGAETLARDTVFAAVMITCNGIVGVSLLFGTMRRRS